MEPSEKSVRPVPLRRIWNANFLQHPATHTGIVGNLEVSVMSTGYGGGYAEERGGVAEELPQIYDIPVIDC